MDVRTQATALVTYHRTDASDAFARFAERIGADAAARPGFASWQHSVLTSPDLDWSIAVTFADEASLHAWLDASRRLLDDDAHRSARIDLIAAGSPRTDGVLLVREAVKDGHEPSYLAASERFVGLGRTWPGYDGSSVFPSLVGAQGADQAEPWSRVVRFRTDQHLRAWLDSPERRAALPDLEQHLSDETSISAITAFSTLRLSDDGVAVVTPTWKTYLMVLVVLYPTAILQGTFVDPLIRSTVTVPWLAGLASMMLNVAILVWVMMPFGSRMLRRWMDPVDGAAPKPTLVGVLAIVAAFAVYLTVFLAAGFLPRT